MEQDEHPKGVSKALRTRDKTLKGTYQLIRGQSYHLDVPIIRALWSYGKGIGCGRR